MAPVDIVTLENFAEKLPQWHADDASHRHALVDMGSNGIRFSISDLAPPATRLLPCIYRERAPISLFDALQPGPDGAMALPPATIAQVAATLARFRRIAVDDYGVAPGRMSVLATEAMRRAANAADLLDAIAAAAPGLAVFVLAPPVETLFGAMGARAAFGRNSGASRSGSSTCGALMLDLGGGSVQVTYVDPGQSPGYEVAAARAGQSLPYGAARLTRMVAEARAAAGGADRPASNDDDDDDDDDASISATTARARADADAVAVAAAAPQLVDDLAAALAQLRAECPGLQAALAPARDDGTTAPPPPLDLYLCGGGFRGYGSMLMHADAVEPYPVPLIHGYAVPGALFADAAHTRFVLHRTGRRTKIAGLSKRRRTQFPAIAAVVDALVAALGRTGFAVADGPGTTGPRIGTVTFCAGGNREGALLMRLPPALREADPLAVLAASEAAAAGISAPVLHAVAAALQAALPVAPDSPDSPGSRRAPLFPPELLPLVAARLWANAGTDAAANATLVLHEAVTRGPSMPGLTHRARALLAVSLWARWGGGVAPADAALLEGLWRVLYPLGAGPESFAQPMFWAEYIGGVAAVLALAFPAPPRSAADVARIRLRPTLTTTKIATATTATATTAKKKPVARLTVAVPDRLAAGLDWASAAAACFAILGKPHSFAPVSGKPYKKHIKLDVVAESFPG